jgi:hypothetical protein
MKIFRDILHGNKKIIADSKFCKNYLYRNFENGINYVVLKSKSTQCIICKQSFSSLSSYVLHLRLYKKHVIEFLFQRMLTSKDNEVNHE